ncbi:MAG TPA: transporter [Pirellulales bacterium]|nr:transporter [Pirellulales bacterium]
MNLKRSSLATIAILLTPITALGQLGAANQAAPPGNEIETDRDSFTPAVTTVDLRRTQIEASYSFIDNRITPNAYSFPEMVLRRGVTDRLELRLGWNYAAGGPTSAVSNVDFGDEDFFVERTSEIMYGLKLRTTRQSGWLPASSLLLEGYTPTSGPSNVSRPTVGEIFGWTLPNGWQWSSAVRFATANDQGDRFNQWAPSTVLNVPVGKRWNVHAEYFGIMSAGKATAESQHYFSTGGHVHMTRNLELGLRVGWGLNHQTPGFFSNVGLGYRF